MKDTIEQRISFLGAGIIAEVWIERLVASMIRAPQEIMACDSRPERLEVLQRTWGVKTSSSNREGVGFSPLVVIATPPGEVLTVLKEIRSKLVSDHLVISLAAGLPLRSLEHVAGLAQVARVMPNTPSLLGEGMNLVAIGSGGVSDSGRARLAAVLDGMGQWFEVPDEEMDYWCALCAVGPTYVFPVIEALASAATAKGLPAERSLRAVAQIVIGAARMVTDARKSPSELKQMISLRTLPEAEVSRIFRDAYDQAVSKLQALGRRLAA